MLYQLTDVIVVVHAVATWFMVGLIWFVQVVHYPLMGLVGSAESVAYAAQHQRRTTWIVAPVMLVEVVAALLVWMVSESSWLGWTGGGLLVVAWGSTFFVQVPLHQQLASGFDVRIHRRLVRTNWLRTGVWSARGVVAVLLLWAV